MTHQTPFIQFKQAISEKLMDDGLFNVDWFANQSDKINRYWLAGETVDSAFMTIRIMAEAQLSANSYRSPTIASLSRVGCEFN
jgi:hypothetical protein|tara:strand:+ start:2232 stop:2480 length:249 start_codon:yes stop_codon:yes gene_type:complete